MRTILICSSNPMLVKNLYGILRDEGYGVETAEHPASAVQMIMVRTFSLVIMDAEPFGLSAGDAVQIMRTVAPDLPVLNLGEEGAAASSSPVDLQRLKNAIHAIAA